MSEKSMLHGVMEMLPDDWKIGVLGNDVKIKGRIGWRGYKTSDLRTSGPVVLGGTNVRSAFYLDVSEIKHLSREKFDESPEIQLKAGDILLVTRGNGLADVAFYDGHLKEATINPSLVILSDFSGDSRFLFYYLVSSYGRETLLSVSSGSSIPAIYQDHLKKLVYPKPSYREQIRIADFLVSLDDKIELNRRMNADLEATARAIFKSWFVNFDPVRAKMRGEQPEGMDAEIAALFPDALVESELGDIPAGWKVGCIGDIAQNPRRGVQPHSVTEDTMYIGLEHMPQQSISLSEWGMATEVQSNKYEFYKGEFLFGKLRPYFHKVGIAPVDGICSTDILVIIPIDDAWWGFLLLVISDSAFIDYTSQVSGGTRMPRVNWQDMSRYKIVLPDARIASAFSKLVESVGVLVIENIHQSRTLAEIRDTLLPKLVSGQIRVEEAEDFMAGSAE